MKNTLVPFFAALLIGSQSFADTYKCTFSSRSAAIPDDVVVSTSDTTDRVGIDDSIRRSIDDGKYFGQLSRETATLLRVKWEFKPVPRAIMAKIKNTHRGVLYYTLEMKKSDGSAKLVARGLTGQPATYRGQGACRNAS